MSRTFTQYTVDKLVEKDRQQHQARLEKLRQGLLEDQKKIQKLKDDIQILEASLTGKSLPTVIDEVLKIKLDEESEEKKKKHQEFLKAQILLEISKAAVVHRAYDPEQIQKLLAPDTSYDEKFGKFRAKFGDSVLTVYQAVECMKHSEQYKNLFRKDL